MTELFFFSFFFFFFAMSVAVGAEQMTEMTLGSDGEPGGPGRADIAEGVVPQLLLVQFLNLLPPAISPGAMTRHLTVLSRCSTIFADAGTFLSSRVSFGLAPFSAMV